MAQKSTVRLIIEPIAIAIVLAIAVRSTIDIYSIPSSSMAPTLRAGDEILVTRYFKSTPSRGDVVVFRSPRNASEFVVKRIVAVPGDLIATTGDGVLTIGGHHLAEPYLGAMINSGVVAPQIVPGDCYFVMGDNRGNSLDSRSWGVLPRTLIVGRARMVLWSTATAGSHRTAFAASSPEPEKDSAATRSFRFFVPIR